MKAEEKTQITSSDGQYSFVFKADSAADGIYTITVSPPSAFKFQSDQIPAETTTYTPGLGGSVEEIQDQAEAPSTIKIQLITFLSPLYLLMKQLVHLMV